VLPKDVTAAISDRSERLPRGPAAASRSAADRLRRQRLETVGRLAGGVAHDINNLLTAIVLNSDVLAESIAEVKLRALAQATRMSAERAGDLNWQLLAFVSAQQLPPRPIDVNAAIAALAPLLHRTLGGHIDVQISTDARPATVVLDSGQFESAILNLALNARDAMPWGGRLAIRTSSAVDDAHRAVDGDPGMVMVAVSDDGSGMTPDVALRALEPFFTTKDVGAGTGLGLSMVQAFARKAGGRLSIDTRAGFGTTVMLLLPVNMARAPEVLALAGHQVGPCGTESILLVEDDRIVRAHIEVALGDLGYCVCGVADPRGALSLFAVEHAFDLLLTDVVIPGGMSGAELAVLLRRRWPDLSILYTSGCRVPPALAARLDNDPHGAFLAKPFRRRELATAVRALLDHTGAPEAVSA